MELRPPEPDLTDGVVTLRPLEPEDVAAVTKACQDPEIVRWTTEIPDGYTEEHARGWIASTPAGWKEDRPREPARRDQGRAHLVAHQIDRAGEPRSPRSRLQPADVPGPLRTWTSQVGAQSPPALSASGRTKAPIALVLVLH